MPSPPGSSLPATARRDSRRHEVLKRSGELTFPSKRACDADRLHGARRGEADGWTVKADDGGDSDGGTYLLLAFLHPPSPRRGAQSRRSPGSEWESAPAPGRGEAE